MRRLICLLAFLFVVPVSAYSHVYMLESDPAPDTVLATPPIKVTMTFAGSIEPLFSKIDVFDAQGKKVSKNKVRCLEDDTVMEVDLEENLPPGVYTVRWKCMSMDGHKQSGDYKFTIK